MKNELKIKLFSLTLTIILVLFALVKNNLLSNNYLNITKIFTYEEYSKYKEYSIDEDINELINNNYDIFDFYTKMFGISLDDLKKSLLNDNKYTVLDYHNIGNAKKEYDSLDKNIIDYLYQLKSTNPKLFKQNYISGKTYSKKYIYSLLNYLSNVYGNVDYEVLAAIAYIESGNLNANYMMSVNNIYGGMSSSHLIKYQNIEYGVLSYVKLMSEKYYAKGLNTVEKIASRYNPGSQTWVGNVKSQITKFTSDDNITINDLINLR